MCGITGFYTRKQSNEQVIQSMVATINHRGPDSFGVFNRVLPNGNQLSLGHARLAIIDLTPEGHQPMIYNGLHIVFNGEIYNYKEIRKKLEANGHTFSSHSDTEVILHSFQEWGKKCVEQFIGMFAFLIWDEKTNLLSACVDRFGVKPFYYAVDEHSFLFGSELKTIMSFPFFEKKIDKKSLEIYFRYGHIPAPHAIFEKTKKLEGGTWLEFNGNDFSLKIEKYWSVTSCYSKGKLKIDYQSAKEELTNILTSSVNYRMVADVPVGVFLSGGYDSALVTSLLQKDRTEKINTFTIGFDKGNNEAPFAKEVANYLGTNHHELYCTEKDALNIIPDLPFYFDEPFADSSAIPTILVSRMARKSVTVALSADGGDEVFFGYERYRSMMKNVEKIKRLNSPFNGLTRILLGKYNQFKNSNKFFENHKLQAGIDILGSTSNAYLNMLDSIESTPELLLKGLLKNHVQTEAIDSNRWESINDEVDKALAFDTYLYLQGDILTKVDRAAMSTSLEGREPLLDHRILEFAAQLPLEFKFNNGVAKRILKDIVHENIPKEMMERPKKGFSIPAKHWLRNELKNYFNEVISEDNLRNNDFFNIPFLMALKTDFLAGKNNYDVVLWRVLQFQLWYDKWMKKN